uniref:Secreted protein n=1 Tax=Heterorhabditis bacteriophora TaxID=37862 RepID=A0A1I7WAX2_HETBA
MHIFVQMRMFLLFIILLLLSYMPLVIVLLNTDLIINIIVQLTFLFRIDDVEDQVQSLCGVPSVILLV